MTISKTTKLTDSLMREIGKQDDPLVALGYLIMMAANAVVDAEDAAWGDRQAVLYRAAEFCTARAAQCAPILEFPNDPDEDIL